MEHVVTIQTSPRIKPVSRCSSAAEVLDFMKATGEEIVATRQNQGVYISAALAGHSLSLSTFADLISKGTVVWVAFDKAQNELEYWRVADSLVDWKEIRK